MKLASFVLGVLLGSVSLSACAVDAPRDESESAALLSSAAPGPISSAAALDLYLVTVSSSPLDRFTLDEKQRFVAGLTFNDGGLSGFRYGELKSLPRSDAYQILRLFGMERTIDLISSVDGAAKPTSAAGTNGLPGDRIGYRCAGTGTCTASQESICTPTCWNGGNPTQPF